MEKDWEFIKNTMLSNEFLSKEDLINIKKIDNKLKNDLRMKKLKTINKHT